MKIKLKQEVIDFLENGHVKTDSQEKRTYVTGQGDFVETEEKNVFEIRPSSLVLKEKILEILLARK